jgi:hypothetical protein
MPDPPVLFEVTCDRCRHSPASAVLVVLRHSSATGCPPVRVLRLLCAECVPLDARDAAQDRDTFHVGSLLLDSGAGGEFPSYPAMIAGLIRKAPDEDVASALSFIGGEKRAVLRAALGPGETRACRHCGEAIRPCPDAHATVPEYPPCKGWRHAGFDPQPVIGHCCGGCGTNPVAEPGEEEP